MKKKILVIITLSIMVLSLGACFKKKTADTKTGQSILPPTSTSDSGSQSSDNVTKDSSKAVVEETPAPSESTTETPQPATVTSESDKFNELPEALRVVLATTTVDLRAYNLAPGLALGYSFDHDLLYVQIHSGAGTGHPIYEISENAEQVLPKKGYAYHGPGDLRLETDFPTSVSKADLYTIYLDKKEYFDSCLAYVNGAPGLTTADFETTFNSIVNQ